MKANLAQNKPEKQSAASYNLGRATQ